jgi:NAD(P)-dependent dehydrogenase (short-subunit alcohol dehydrogenase family)
MALIDSLPKRDTPMKVILVGSTGAIGQALVQALSGKHDLVQVSRSHGEYQVDISSKDSIQKLFETVAPFDAVICVAGMAKFSPLNDLSDEDFQFCLSNKLMGQVNLVRVGLQHISDRGSFTLTSGIMAQEPVLGSAAISMVNAGIEGFAIGAALEITRGIRVNAVSPPFLSETLTAMEQDPSTGMPANQVALAYLESIEGQRNGEVIAARSFAT